MVDHTSTSPSGSPAENLPPMPTIAAALVPEERRGLLAAYATFLADAGTVRGLIGPREVPRLWDRHVLNCAALAEVLPHGSEVADIGSGAGLPGLVISIVRPDLHVTLIEPLLRRTNFLSEAVESLGLTNVEVVRGRADAFHGVRTFDVLTSRAVAPLGRLLEWSMPLVRPDGALVAMKGSAVLDEIEEARPELARFGCAEPTVTELGAGILDSTTLALRVAWADPSRVSLSPVKRATQKKRSPKKRASDGGSSEGGQRRSAMGSSRRR